MTQSNGDGSQRFGAEVLLTVTTGRLLTKGNGPRDNGIGDFYKLLGWMTDDSPFTHQLPRFAAECKPWLLRWFPELANAEAALPQLDAMLKADGSKERAIAEWISSLGVQEFYDVPRIPADDHDHKDPLAELIEMRGTDEGIIVVREK